MQRNVPLRQYYSRPNGGQCPNRNLNQNTALFSALLLPSNPRLRCHNCPSTNLRKGIARIPLLEVEATTGGLRLQQPTTLNLHLDNQITVAARQIRHAYRISTVVPDIHVERPSVRKRPCVPKSARHSQRPQRPQRPRQNRNEKPRPWLDIHAGIPPDTNSDLRRRENVASPATTVDIRVKGASDGNIGERIEQQTSYPIKNLP